MELTNEQRNDIAMETAEYWKYNCNDDDFYYNCRDTITQELEYINQETPFDSEDEFDREYRIILNLVNEVYSKDNWKAIKFFDENSVRGVVIAQYRDVRINNITIKNVWSIELEYNMVMLYNAINELIGSISYYDIIDIELGDNDGNNDI